MTHLIIKHKVQDYSTWKQEFDNFADFRRTSGEKSYRILHPSENPNDLTVLLEWDTTQKAKTFLQSSELKSAMEKAGVSEEPKIQFLNEISKGTL